MKAIIYSSYGPADVLKLEEVEKPVPADDQVLIKVRAAAVNPLDWRLMRGGPLVFRLLFGLRKPKDPRVGRDVAGEVESVGRNVTQFKAGDRVFGTCLGAFAEYACARASKLALIPDTVTFEQAAAVPVAGITALQGLRDHGRLRPGQTVLINGAAGGVGTFAVQIAKWLGAHVTGVCSTKNVDLVRSLGADRVIDYSQEDFTAGAERYDLMLDNVANRSLSDCRRVLTPHGKCVVAGAPKEMGAVLARTGGIVLLSLVGRKFQMMFANINTPDLTTMADLIASGKLKPVIDRRYPLSEIHEAIRYVETGHAPGKVVIST